MNFDSNSLSIDASTDRVGIGTADPISNLEIESTGGPTLTLSRNDITVLSGEVIGTLSFYSNDSTLTSNTAGYIRVLAEGNFGNTRPSSRMDFFTDNASGDAGAVKMTLDGAGQLGLRTTTPGINSSSEPAITLVDTSDSLNGSYLEFSKTSNNIADGKRIGMISFHAGSANNTIASIYTLVEGTSENSGELYFTTMNAGSSGIRMTLDENGNVGVGDSTPASLFTVGNGDLFQVNSSGQLSFTPGTTGTFTDYVLETEWTNGTLINADFAGATTQSGGDITGLSLNLNSNLTGATDLDVTL